MTALTIVAPTDAQLGYIADLCAKQGLEPPRAIRAGRYDAGQFRAGRRLAGMVAAVKSYRVEQVSPVLVALFLEAEDEDDALQQAAQIWVEQSAIGAHFVATECEVEDVRV